MQDQVNATPASQRRVPWNKSKLTGAKPPLRPKHVWSIRTKLQIEGRARGLAMFNLAIDSKLRGCDVVAMRSRISPPAGTRRIAQPSDKRKPGGPSDSKYANRPARPSMIICRPPTRGPASSCSQVVAARTPA